MYYTVTYSYDLKGPAEGKRATFTDIVSAPSKVKLPEAIAKRWPMHKGIRIESAAPAPDRTWRIRVGDGNQGTFDQGTINAPTPELALRRAGVSVARCEINGDDEHLVASHYSPRLEYCNYIAEAIA